MGSLGGNSIDFFWPEKWPESQICSKYMYRLVLFEGISVSNFKNRPESIELPPSTPYQLCQSTADQIDPCVFFAELFLEHRLYSPLIRRVPSFHSPLTSFSAEPKLDLVNDFGLGPGDRVPNSVRDIKLSYLIHF